MGYQGWGMRLTVLVLRERLSAEDTHSESLKVVGEERDLDEAAIL